MTSRIFCFNFFCRSYFNTNVGRPIAWLKTCQETYKKWNDARLSIAQGACQQQVFEIDFVLNKSGHLQIFMTKSINTQGNIYSSDSSSITSWRAPIGLRVQAQ
jgi:hypothetical protein